MSGIKDLFASERGIFAIALVVAATVLTAIGVLTKDDWIAYTQWIGVALIASKTVTTAIDSVTSRPSVTVVPPATTSGQSVTVNQPGAP